VYRVSWPDLRPTQFRHPIDTQSTKALQQFFPLEFLIRQGSSGVVEQFMFLDNMSSGVRVGPNQLPKIYALLQEAKQVLGLNIPVDLYVKQNPSPNAYTMAMQGKKPFIVVHSSLIELMTPDELQAVIAHELGHLKCEHGVWITVGFILKRVAIGSSFQMSRPAFLFELVAQSARHRSRLSRLGSAGRSTCLKTDAEISGLVRATF